MLKQALSAMAALAVLALTYIAGMAESMCLNGNDDDIRLYTRKDCPVCTEAEVFLYREGLSFLPPFDADDPSVQEQLNHGPGYQIMPVLNICGTWIVGFGPEQEARIRTLFPQRVRYRPR